MVKNKNILIYRIFVLLLIFQFAATTVQAADYSFDMTWGSFGSESGNFSSPGDVFVDSAGIVYVADTGNARIQKFNSDGTYIAQWNTSATDVFVDSAGIVYVAAWDSIHKYNSDGTYITSWGSFGTGNGQFRDAEGVSVDSEGNVYVADSMNNRIQKFSSDGTYLTQWGSMGFGGEPGLMYLPWDVSVDSEGNVYVADSSNCRIQIFNSTGAYLRQLGGFPCGSGNGELSLPQGVSVDSAGNVYVVDTGNNRIEIFNSDGTYLTQWGSYGSGDGQFNDNTYGVSVDSAGNVYVADRDNHRLQKFAPAPTPTITVSVPNGGESWNRAKSYEIIWNSANNPGENVIITLLKNGVVDSTIVSSTANDGSYNWTIPSSETLGSDYKIKVTSTSNSAYTDDSDNTFSITKRSN